MKYWGWIIGLNLLLGAAHADEVRIEFAEFQQQGDAWRVAVTLAHADTGWEHYADAWRVVDADGRVLGTRKLLHPHVDEQPFTRSLTGLVIAPEQSIVYVEAHDKRHGWTAKRLQVDLRVQQGPRFRVRR